MLLQTALLQVQAFLVAVLVYIGLTLVGIRDALVLAFLAGLFEIIPLFGPILAAIPAVTLALVTNGISSALLVIGLYIIIHQFENQLIYPLVVRKIVGVPPIISILALIVGFKLAGFVGLLISVPLATMLIEFLVFGSNERFLEGVGNHADRYDVSPFA